MPDPPRAAQALRELVRTHPAVSGAAAALREGQSCAIGGLWGASSALVLAALHESLPGAVLAAAPSEDAADDLQDAITAFGGRPLRFAAPSSASEDTGGRLVVLRALARDPIVVASLAALEAEVPTPSHLSEATLRIAPGDRVALAELARRLEAAGLSPAGAVEAPGEFAHRGGILDAFGWGEAGALRIEWEGDAVASLRIFDPGTQRSGEALSEATLLLPRALTGMSGTLLDHLPSSAWICVTDPALFWERADHLRQKLKARPCLALSPLRASLPAQNVTVDSAERMRLHEDLAALARRAAEGWQVAAALRSDEEAARFLEVAARHPPLPGMLLSLPGRIGEGFAWKELRIAAIDGAQAVHRAPIRRRLPQGRPIESFLELRRGDYVVHGMHGIGRFRGLETLRGPDGALGEFLALEFQDGAVVYVPADRIDLVQKYVGAGAGRPRLSKVGERRWAAAQAQASAAAEGLAAEILRSEALRGARQRAPYPADDELVRAFEAGFPFAPTPDQQAAMDDVQGDLAGPNPMDRLVCGDVGCGKTELAVRAVFRAAAAGRQAAVLVPTTILALQHLETFSARLAPFAVRVEGMSRMQPPTLQREILERLAAGATDVVIGTHRLLQADVGFRDLALLVVDEEQRFGVAHKQVLKRLRATVDVLTLTATPIPRTLHAALLGIRPISNIGTLPEGRQPIRTAVCPWSEGILEEAVRREIARGGQCFVVHNRVHSIEDFAGLVRRLVPEARVLVAHGQMPPERIEKVMLAFVSGGADVLVSTTIIESGLDIPSANTLVVHEAHRFGLSDLHQLRGRVGRSDRIASAYFLLPEKGPAHGDAKRRLKAIEEFCELGAGFHLALRDLEIRGAGNLLGREQSGHIAAVGYELYCRLLERAVRRMKGAAVASEPSEDAPSVEFPVEAFLPEAYLPDTRHRMEHYRLLSKASTPQGLAASEESLKDLGGPLPPPAARLMAKHRLRLALPAYTVTGAALVPEGIRVRFASMEKAGPLLERLGGVVRPQEAGEVIVAPKQGKWTAEEAFARLAAAVMEGG